MASGFSSALAASTAATSSLPALRALTSLRQSLASVPFRSQQTRKLSVASPASGGQARRQTNVCQVDSGRSLYDINEPPSGDGKVDRTELNLLQYQQLKADINKTNQTCSALLFGYLFLQTPEVGACFLLGSICGYGYLQTLMRDVDNFSVDDPIAAAFLQLPDSGTQLDSLRSVKRVLAGFRAAFRPRLLILVGLAAATAGYNAVAPEHLPTGDMAALLIGFLSYKAGLVGQVLKAVREAPADDYVLPPNFSLDEAEILTDEQWRARLSGKRQSEPLQPARNPKSRYFD